MNTRISVVGGAVLSPGYKFIAYEIIFPDKSLFACKTHITQWIQTAIYVCQLTDRMYVCQLMDECVVGINFARNCQKVSTFTMVRKFRKGPFTLITRESSFISLLIAILLVNSF